MLSYQPDIEALGEEVRTRVLAQSGVQLEWEIQRVGNPSPLAGEGKTSRRLGEGEGS